MIKVQSKLSHKQGADDLFNKQTMDLNIYKDKRNSGKHYHFSWGIGKNVMNTDSMWFTSDEIEAFREIWQRRISHEE